MLKVNYWTLDWLSLQRQMLIFSMLSSISDTKELFALQEALEGAGHPEAQECFIFLLVQNQERVKLTCLSHCSQHFLRTSRSFNRISFHPSQFGCPCYNGFLLCTSKNNQIQINGKPFKITWNNQIPIVIEEVWRESNQRMLTTYVVFMCVVLYLNWFIEYH